MKGLSKDKPKVKNHFSRGINGRRETAQVANTTEQSYVFDGSEFICHFKKHVADQKSSKTIRESLKKWKFRINKEYMSLHQQSEFIQFYI